MLVKRIRFPKIFFGWWTVIATGIIGLWSAGFALYGFAALFKPIASELGFSRAATSVAASISRLEGGLEGPIAGWITDRFGPRVIDLFGIFLIGLGLMLMYFVNSLWAFYLIWGVMIGTGSNMGNVLAGEVAIANWFVRKRGLAMSIRWVLGGLSGVVILPLVAWLIITQGWRMTVLIGGIGTWLIGLPLAWFCFRPHRPEYYGLLPDGATTEATDVSQTIDKGIKYAAEFQEVEFTLRQAMRTRAYWLFIVAETLHGVAMPAISLHAVPFLTDIGIAPLRAAGMVSMLLLVGLPLRVVGGLIADRVAKDYLRFLLGGAYLIQAIGFGLYLLNQNMTMIYVWFIVYGIGNGLAYGLRTPLRGRYFGRKAIGSINGTSSSFMMPVGIAVPVYLGWAYDTTGSYITAFTLVAILLAIAAVVMSFIRPPKPPAVVTDIRKIV